MGIIRLIFVTIVVLFSFKSNSNSVRAADDSLQCIHEYTSKCCDLSSLNNSVLQANNGYHHEQFQNEQSITRSETSSLEDVEERFCFIEQHDAPHLFLLLLSIWTEAMVQFCLHPVYLPIELGEDLHQSQLSALTTSIVEANWLRLYTML